MSTETTAIRILIEMKRFVNLGGVIWTAHMISEAIREDDNEVRCALRFLEKNGYVSAVRTDYQGEVCVEYDITSEGHQAVVDAQYNPRADNGASEWIRRARSGFNTVRKQSNLDRVAIPKGKIVEEESMSMEEQLDFMRAEEAWSRDFE
jgi:DNA-binding PadR family transcriptional regulator